MKPGCAYMYVCVSVVCMWVWCTCVRGWVWMGVRVCMCMWYMCVWCVCVCMCVCDVCVCACVCVMCVCVCVCEMNGKGHSQSQFVYQGYMYNRQKKLMSHLQSSGIACQDQLLGTVPVGARGTIVSIENSCTAHQANCAAPNSAKATDQASS